MSDDKINSDLLESTRQTFLTHAQQTQISPEIAQEFFQLSAIVSLLIEHADNTHPHQTVPKCFEDLFTVLEGLEKSRFPNKPQLTCAEEFFIIHFPESDEPYMLDYLNIPAESLHDIALRILLYISQQASIPLKDIFDPLYAHCTARGQRLQNVSDQAHLTWHVQKIMEALRPHQKSDEGNLDAEGIELIGAKRIDLE